MARTKTLHIGRPTLKFGASGVRPGVYRNAVKPRGGGSAQTIFDVLASKLNAVDQWFEVPGNPAALRIETNMSVFAWVKPGASNGRILSKFLNTSDQRAWNLGGGAGSAVSAQLYGNGSGGQETASAVGNVMSAGWNHIGFVYNGSTIKLYQNGVQTASTAFNFGIFDSTAIVQVGRWEAAGSLSDAGIAFPAIWSTDKSALQVIELFNDGVPVCVVDQSDDLNTSLEWAPSLCNFDDNEGNELVDRSPNGLTTTNVGDTPFTDDGLTVVCGAPATCQAHRSLNLKISTSGFRNTSGFADIPHDPLFDFGGDDFALYHVVKFNATPYLYTYNRWNDVSGKYTQIYIQQSGLGIQVVASGVNNFVALFDTPLVSGQSYRIALVRDNNIINAYANEVKGPDLDITGEVFEDVVIETQIGATPLNGRYTDADFANWIVVNGAPLTTADINELAVLRQLTDYSEELKEKFTCAIPFNSGFAAPGDDVSGNGFDATIHGGANYTSGTQALYCSE